MIIIGGFSWNISIFKPNFEERNPLIIYAILF